VLVLAGSIVTSNVPPDISTMAIVLHCCAVLNWDMFHANSTVSDPHVKSVVVIDKNTASVVGRGVGGLVGTRLGSEVGSNEGARDGASVGNKDGTDVGPAEGTIDGIAEGERDG
jgi:hypothetical protein